MSLSVFLSMRPGVWLLQAGGGNGRNVGWRQCWHSLSSFSTATAENGGRKALNEIGRTQPPTVDFFWFTENCEVLFRSPKHWDSCAVATVATQQPDQWAVISSHICSLMSRRFNLQLSARVKATCEELLARPAKLTGCQWQVRNGEQLRRNRIGTQKCVCVGQEMSIRTIHVILFTPPPLSAIPWGLAVYKLGERCDPQLLIVNRCVFNNCGETETETACKTNLCSRALTSAASLSYCTDTCF